MRNHVYTQSDTYPIAILVKGSAFNLPEIEATYTKVLEKAGISRDDLLIAALEYNEKGKAPVKFIKEYLEGLMNNLDSVGAKTLYCADANYFKVLTRSSKAEPHLGYTLQCKLDGYEHMQVVLGVNHKSLIYNPANEPKLILSIDTLAAVVQGNYQGLGVDIIHNAQYPKTTGDIINALDAARDHPRLTADFEAFSLDHDKAGLGSMCLSWNQHEGIAFACDYAPYSADFVGPVPKGHHGRFVPNPDVRMFIKEFFEEYEGTLIWHNANYDLKIAIATLWMDDLLDTNGLLKGLEIVAERFEDTKIIAYLALNSTANGEDKSYLSLKNLAHSFAGNWAQEDIKDIRLIPLDELLQYNLVDGLATNWVFDKYYPIMVAENQLDIYENLLKPSVKTILQMELTGMPLNPARVQEAKAELSKIVAEQEFVFQSSGFIQRFNRRLAREEMMKANAKLKVKQHPIEKFADVRMNPGSGPQLQKLLFEEMGLPVIDLTDTRLPATGGKTLKKLINHATDPEHKKIIQALMDRSLAAKILNTFIPAFEKALDKGDGVVWLHGNFNLGGTVSGRLSSSKPNLQNIPAGSIYGKLIKSCFQAPKGWIFCGADFNSLEDYISALTTKDPNKLKVYTDGYDGHCLRAFNYFPDELPGIVDTVSSINSIKVKFPDLRQDSKAPTFLLTYGGTYHGMMKNLGWEKDKAIRLEANYHEMYKVSDQWVQDKLDEAVVKGHVEVAFGLRLRTPLLSRTIKGKRPREADAEGRTAGNALGQSYGLLNNRAANEFMQKVWKSKYRFDIKPVAMIHDAIYLVIKDDIDVVEWVNQALITSMQWQELPEIQHKTVTLGAELSLFWPSWADELVLPNDVSSKEIRALSTNFYQGIQGKIAA
jgi:DNA polymerase-1